MCWACEEEQMLAAYRDYVAQRKAQRGQAGSASKSADTAAAAPEDPDWAKGTWFAAAIDPQE